MIKFVIFTLVVATLPALLSSFLTARYCKTKGRRYLHVKTGKIYVGIQIVTDCTNARDGAAMMLYRRESDLRVLFVRDLQEFQVKFQKI
jgi:hypothetical protein